MLISERPLAAQIKAWWTALSASGPRAGNMSATLVSAIGRVVWSSLPLKRKVGGSEERAPGSTARLAFGCHPDGPDEGITGLFLRPGGPGRLGYGQPGGQVSGEGGQLRVGPRR